MLCTLHDVSAPKQKHTRRGPRMCTGCAHTARLPRALGHTGHLRSNQPGGLTCAASATERTPTSDDAANGSAPRMPRDLRAEARHARERDADRHVDREEVHGRGLHRAHLVQVHDLRRRRARLSRRGSCATWAGTAGRRDMKHCGTATRPLRACTHCRRAGLPRPAAASGWAAAGGAPRPGCPGRARPRSCCRRARRAPTRSRRCPARRPRPPPWPPPPARAV